MVYYILLILSEQDGFSGIVVPFHFFITERRYIIMEIADIIILLGGLAFFLFGMSLLGEGLKRVAGSKLEVILAKLTSNTFLGVLLGTVVTAVIQSSSATTVMVVGFVNSGIMKLSNAIGIIMGANIGTTATGWVLVLAGVEGGGLFSSAVMFAMVAFIGIILYFFCKSQQKKNVGMIMLAFAVLMTGMQTMSGAMAPLKESAFFLDFISTVSNPFLAMLVGAIVTAIIQSCSASIGILQALSVTGVIGYDVALPMTIGMCIGACAPVLLSAIGANVNGKRTAFVYLIFNLTGALILMVPFYLIHSFVDFSFMSATATSMGIAILNTIFKVAATLLLMPFAGLLKKIVVLLIPDSKNSEAEHENLLEPRLLAYPPLALEQSELAIRSMSTASMQNLHEALGLVKEFDPAVYASLMAREDKVDSYEDRLGRYLVQLNAKPLSKAETATSAKYFSYLSNIERISDHALNIAELAEEMHQKKIVFSPQALKELEICFAASTEIATLTEKAIETNDADLAHKIAPLEEVIDLITKEMKSGHIQRVQSGQCTLVLGFIFNDIVNNLERVSDHCANIGIAILESRDPDMEAHKYLSSLNLKDQEAYQSQLQMYIEKYCRPLSAKK